MAQPDPASLVPLSLPRDLVRVVFPVEPTDPVTPLSQLAAQTYRLNATAPAGTPVTVSYAFASTGPSDYTPDHVKSPPNYAAFTDAEKANVAAVLAAYQAVSGLTFTLQDDPATALMVFRKADLDVSGFAYYPPFSGFGPSSLTGDVYLHSTVAAQPYIVFHEVGHSLGLRHAYDFDPTPEDFGFAPGRYLTVVDQRQVLKPYYIVGGNSVQTIFHPTTPSPLDVLALQMLYGQNTATNAGNTTYTYEVNPNFFQTLWDGGGNDTIDLSNQTAPNVVSLVGGTFTSIGLRDPFAGLSPSTIELFTTSSGIPPEKYNDGSNMLAIAFDAIIENATGGSAADRLIGNEVANRLSGGAGADTLEGAAGADTLDGGTDADAMSGGAGDDTYTVDHLSDTVTESPEADGGKDTILSAVSFTAPEQVENLTLTGTLSINAAGNAGANDIRGNDGDNILWGLQGNDTLLAGNGNDTLVGGEGDDALDGRAGADSMVGGTGNDSYSVENAGDTVTELAGEGTDSVKTNLITYTLASTLENLFFTGSAASRGTGNDLNNGMEGNGGNNTLLGGKGDDTLNGGAGNDSLDGGTGADKLVGGAGNDIYNYGTLDRIEEAANGGIDTVNSAININLGATLENVTLVGNTATIANGNALGNVINGNALANTLKGGAGDDTMNGGAGDDAIFGGKNRDVLTGGAGNDTFSFEGLADSTVAAPDLITDLQAGDKLDFSLIDANPGLAGNQAFAHVAAFTGAAGELTLSYNATTNQTRVSLNTTADTVADMAVLLTGQVTHTSGWLL